MVQLLGRQANIFKALFSARPFLMDDENEWLQYQNDVASWSCSKQNEETKERNNALNRRAKIAWAQILETAKPADCRPEMLTRELMDELNNLFVVYFENHAEYFNTADTAWANTIPLYLEDVLATFDRIYVHRAHTDTTKATISAGIQRRIQWILTRHPLDPAAIDPLPFPTISYVIVMGHAFERVAGAIDEVSLAQILIDVL
jgi:hypothetical protein